VAESRWDATRRVQLDPPWEQFWIERYVDPPIGDWLALAETAGAAVESTTPANLDAACAALRRLIAAHNLTDRAGEPIAISFESLTYSLFLAIVTAAQSSSGESAGPKGKKATSPGPSSRRSRSRLGSSSSSQQAGTA
jgi:hypothetical protein